MGVLMVNRLSAMAKIQPESLNLTKAAIPGSLPIGTGVRAAQGSVLGRSVATAFIKITSAVSPSTARIQAPSLLLADLAAEKRRKLLSLGCDSTQT